MRAVLGADPRPAVRALALRGPDEAIALLDAWALVANAVSFYTERIAQEGFLRTATERESVRWLARTLGYELRPAWRRPRNWPSRWMGPAPPRC